MPTPNQLRDDGELTKLWEEWHAYCEMFGLQKDRAISYEWWLAKLEEAKKEAVEGERERIDEYLDGMGMSVEIYGNEATGFNTAVDTIKSILHPHSKDEKLSE